MIDNRLTRVNPTADSQPVHTLKLQPSAPAACPVRYGVPDARVQRIYGETNEIMKELAARCM